ncbi:hypothetical protein GCM10010430_77780 [Kitasatospora cystarginea]|uniref:Alpha/beta hydrolase n=2 Tax=Streptomycetaceae TaxID=2062 RepID=A0ABN3F0N2_9ACTN
MSEGTLPEATYVRTVMGSGPGLVLAHGAGSSIAGTYGPILEGLAAGHTVVGVTARTPHRRHDAREVLKVLVRCH